MLNTLKQFILSNGILKYLGFQSIRIYLRLIKKQVIGKNAKIGFSSKLEGKNSIGENSSFIGSKIGFASYVSKNSQLQNIKIGKYCSIGPNVLTIHGTHPTKIFVSTHPAFFSPDLHFNPSYTKKQLFKEQPDRLIENEPYTTEIGNDVWIGASVNIIEGVKIGDGCIIASGALVNKDIPPYSIVGGVPVKFIRKRFDDSDIAFLLRFKWWERSEKWIIKNAHLFTDIKSFIQENQQQ